MRKMLNAGLFALIIPMLVIGCADVGEGDTAETGEKVVVENNEPVEGGTWAIDTSQSSLRWTGAKVTRSHEGGFHLYDGNVTVDNGEVTHVVINVQTASIWTDSDKLVGHLKSPDFFDVEKYPTATFEASTFEPADSGAATHMVTGNLTMRDQTRGITFPATINVTGSGVTAKANFIINRQEWGITYPGAPDDLVSDDVRITFDIVAPSSGTGIE